MNPLLDIIAGQETDGFYEIRCLPSGKQEFHPLADRERVNARCFALSAQTDVFIGAAIRARRGGGRDAIDRVWALWADCDVEKGAFAFAHPPTLEVASGTQGNIHAWWALTHPIPTAWAAKAIRRLVHHVGADPKAKDVARVMRPPGTLNHKHSPARSVEIVEFRDVRYTAAALVADIPDPKPERAPVTAARRPNPSDDLERLPVTSYYAGLTGWEPSVSRHVMCPFWEHRSNPAMKLYPKTETWHCFACDRGGDVYEFGAALWDMDRRTEFVALRRKLLDELGVNG